MNLDDIVTTYYLDDLDLEVEVEVDKENSSDDVSGFSRWPHNAYGSVASKEEEQQCLSINSVFNFAQQTTRK